MPLGFSSLSKCVRKVKPQRRCLNEASGLRRNRGAAPGTDILNLSRYAPPTLIPAHGNLT
jgi:hypothetical protein